MSNRSLLPLALLTALAGCVETPPPRAIAPPPSVSGSPAGLDRIIGQDAKALIALFGDPDLDVREGPARKLQFTSGICVLDAYLYPPAATREPVVRHVDARLPNGDDFDRPSCVAALSRRGKAR